MPAPSDLKSRATAAVEANREELLALSRAIHADPEPAFEEHRAAARCSSKAGSGSAWIARESARISSRFASTAAVARDFRSDGAGMRSSKRIGRQSALDRERELGEHDEHDDEDGDR